MENLEHWSDDALLSAAQKYGEEARAWRNKFLGLLPEINRRKLYEQKGFPSIFYFAKVLGGVSEEQVEKVLRLERRFQEMPALHQLLITGEVSISKMDRIASVAEPSNEEFLASQAQILSKNSLDTLVKDIKHAEVKSSPGRTSALPSITETMQVAVPLQEEVAQELLELREKGIDIDAFIKDALEERKESIEREKEAIATACQETSSRYIPQAVRNMLTKEYGTKCSIDTCTKPSAEIHHTQRFSLARKHNPNYMAPLCKEHHQIAHSIDLKVQEKKRPK